MLSSRFFSSCISVSSRNISRRLGIYSASNGYVSGPDAGTSDIVYVLAPDGEFTTYYYQTDPFDGFFRWRRLENAGDNSTDAGLIKIPVGSAIIIKHTGSGLDWTDATPYTL